MRLFIRLVFLGIALSVSLGAGYVLGVQKAMEKSLAADGGESASSHSTESAHATSEGKGKILYYRNPMGLPDTSPVPKQDEMGMDYVPVYENEAAQEPGAVRVSADRIQRLGVKSEAIARRSLSYAIRAVGTVQIDETKQSVVSPRFEGWIEKMFASATGQAVKSGDPLFSMYSPLIVQIESEYLANATANGGGKNGSLARLRTLAVPEEEIARLQKERKISASIVMRAPMDGTVLEKQAIEGLKFSPGDRLYRLVDLSRVWMIAEVFEQDLARIAVGQNAKIKMAVFENRTFEGKVGFIYPDINPATRTTKIRIELANPDTALRTDMYGEVELESSRNEPVLAVPTSALLNNGQSKVVLLERGEGLYQPRMVKTGLIDNGYAEILEGLSEGDRVVTGASFLIDAESNIRAALQNFAQESKQP